MYKLLLTLTVVVASLLLLSLVSTVNSAEIEDCSKIDQDTWLCLSNNFSYDYRLNLAKDEMVLRHDRNLQIGRDGVVTSKTKQFFTESDITVSKDFGGIQRIKVLYGYIGKNGASDFSAYWQMSRQPEAIAPLIFSSPVSLTFKPNIVPDFVFQMELVPVDNSKETKRPSAAEYTIVLDRELSISVQKNQRIISSTHHKQNVLYLDTLPCRTACNQITVAKCGKDVRVSFSDKTIYLQNAVLISRQWSTLKINLVGEGKIKMEKLVLYSNVKRSIFRTN